MKSIFFNFEYTKKYPRLIDDNKRDIVIVGGGIAGLMAAHKLSEKHKVTLIEAQSIMSGTTKDTTAHITYMQGVFSKLYKKSKINAKLYLASQLEGIREIEKTINANQIDCGFKSVDEILYTEKFHKGLKKEYEALKKLGADIEYAENFEIFNLKNLSCIKANNQAVFNPLKFLKDLPKNFEILENTRILEIDTDNKILYTLNHQIRADKIIIATNFPIVNVRGFYFMKMYKSTSYAIAIKSSQNIFNSVTQMKQNGMTLRFYNDSIIIGGYDHRSGRPKFSDAFKKLEGFAFENFDAVNVTDRWSANDCMTSDGIPYVGRLFKKNDDILIISGFNKWGMANSAIAANVIFDIVQNKENAYVKLFDPRRKKQILPFFIVNALTNVKNLILKPFTFLPVKKSESLKCGEGQIAWHKGKKQAVYKDENKKLHVCNHLCSHLKCQMKFNDSNLTWECPCHGSRYDIEGNILCGPTNREI
ncbi:MAG: FAD-dependent oxidoreductase [Firmicutes bacterium]|nr:FAD-dependent oxidoreductase [Bacillota bacterium]